MEKKILLSICIPTFNRGELCHMLVKELLQIKSDEVEIFVSDNHSSDNTEQLLSSIHDERLHYHRNDVNLRWNSWDWCFGSDGGGGLNGKFCLLIRDKDTVLNVAQWFESVKTQLESADENCMFLGNVLSPDSKIEVPVPQYAFLRNTPGIYISILNMHTYVTSIILPRKILMNIYDEAKKSAPYYWTCYAHISLMLHCAKYSDRLPLPSLMVQKRETNVFADVKGWDGSSSEPYWTVESRNKQNVDLVRLFKALNLSQEVLIPVLVNLVNRQFNWFMAAFNVIHSNIVNHRLDIVERDRKRPVTYWHYMFWKDYADITTEIRSQFGFSLANDSTLSIAFNYYNQLLNLTTNKELGAYSNL